MTRILATNILILSSVLTGCDPKPAPPADQLTPAAQNATAIPDGIDPAQTSDDPTYAYTKENPVRVGFPDEYSGPAASQVYLRHLRDINFKPVRFERIGSFGAGPDGHIVDKYLVTSSTGEKVEIYIDMYHPEQTPLRQLAPKGMYFWK